MNVASLSLCKELYELSGWDDSEKVWCHYIGAGNTAIDAKPWVRSVTVSRSDDVPAYDLGYLLRKLPITQDYLSPYKLNRHRANRRLGVVYYLTLMAQHSTGGFIAGYLRFNRQTNGTVPYWWCGEKKAYGKLVGIADTPEDAAAKLAIELFKQGVLKKVES